MAANRSTHPLSPDMARAELCRRSFYRFLLEFWHVLSPEEFKPAPHIKYLCAEMQHLNGYVERREPKPYDLVINIPPGTTKSTIVSQAYTAWVWTRDPAQRHIGSSYSATRSLKNATKCRDIISSAKYRRLFPYIELKADQTAKSDYLNTEGGQRFTTSTSSGVTGEHAHQILIDDPLNAQQSSSKAEREAAYDHVMRGLPTRVVDKDMAPIILVMQRLHEEDPAGAMLASGDRVKHICLPAEESEHVSPSEARGLYAGGLLDPVRLGRDALNSQKTKLGSYAYAGQFSQRPAPDSGGIFQRDWFQLVDWSPEYASLTWHFAADTAYTSDEKNDPSGWIAYAQTGADFIVRSAETVLAEFPELCERLPAFAHLNGYSRRSLIRIEPKASGKSLRQTLSRQTSLNVVESKNPNRDKVARAKDASPKVEAGRVKLVRGAWNTAFLDEVCTFPNAPHDEYVDVLCIMLNESDRRKFAAKRRN